MLKEIGIGLGVLAFGGIVGAGLCYHSLYEEGLKAKIADQANKDDQAMKDLQDAQLMFYIGIRTGHAEDKGLISQAAVDAACEDLAGLDKCAEQMLGISESNQDNSDKGKGQTLTVPQHDHERTL